MDLYTAVALQAPILRLVEANVDYHSLGQSCAPFENSYPDEMRSVGTVFHNDCGSVGYYGMRAAS